MTQASGFTDRLGLDQPVADAAPALLPVALIYA